VVVSQALIVKIILITIGLIISVSILEFLISVHPPKILSSNTPKDYGIDYENVSFTTSDEILIKGWLLTSKKANGTVIVGHGYPFDKGNIFSLAKFLYPEYNLLLYDHRYFGESSGTFSTAGLKEVEDVKAAFKFVREKFGDEPIAFYGISLSASTMLMAKQDVNAIVVDSPYASLKLAIEHIYSIFGPLKFPFVFTTDLVAKVFFKTSLDQISPALAVKDYDVPIFIIHGSEDKQILVENSHIIKEKNPDIELWIVDGAGHSLSYSVAKDEYEKRVRSFLRRHMK